MFEVTNTTNAPAAIGPYSQAISANGFLFASGQIPLSPETGEVVGTTITEQAEQSCKNVGGILEANGLNFENLRTEIQSEISGILNSEIESEIFYKTIVAHRKLNFYCSFKKNPEKKQNSVKPYKIIILFLYILN